MPRCTQRHGTHRTSTRSYRCTPAWAVTASSTAPRPVCGGCTRRIRSMKFRRGASEQSVTDLAGATPTAMLSGMEAKVKQPAPPAERFDARAFDDSVGHEVTVHAADGSTRGRLVAATVVDDGD